MVVDKIDTRANENQMETQGQYIDMMGRQRFENCQLTKLLLIQKRNKIVNVDICEKKTNMTKCVYKSVYY